MHGQEKFDRFVEKHPHPHKIFFARPHVTRRRFLELAGAGVTLSYLAGPMKASSVEPQAQVGTLNKAKYVIFIQLAGAPSHTDTFDLKELSGVTPADFNPATINGIRWPTGLMPNLANNLGDIAIVRSMRSWALVHSLAQLWSQIGRNPAAALGDIAPNIGSVVSREKEAERKANQVFPTFIALNSAQSAGEGYLAASFAPFRVNPSAAGVPNTTNPDGSGWLQDRWNMLYSIDDALRVNSPLGKPVEDMDGFYTAAKKLTYNPVVDQAFRFTAADSLRYGNTGFGNSCLVAKQILAANQGTRFVQITQGGWDMHVNIYNKQANPNGSIYALSKLLDNGVSALLNDLKSTGLLKDTLVVMSGEFGRTVGPLTSSAGRDHYVQQFSMFAGAGIRGGRALGVTDATGSDVLDFGWSRQRYVRPEDIEATIYSAMGINWTNIDYGDPFHRGFEYVPFSKEDLYGPVVELWS